jgi:hypothetical protein
MIWVTSDERPMPDVYVSGREYRGAFFQSKIVDEYSASLHQQLTRRV